MAADDSLPSRAVHGMYDTIMKQALSYDSVKSCMYLFIIVYVAVFCCCCCKEVLVELYDRLYINNVLGLFCMIRRVFFSCYFLF